MSANKATRDLLNALAAHRKWKERLDLAIKTGKSDFKPEIVKLDDRCDFGKWLYHQTSPEEQRSSYYQTVKQLHAKFHFEIAHILELTSRGEHEQAKLEMAFGGGFAATSGELISNLTAWYMELGKTGDGQVSEEKNKSILADRARALAQSKDQATGESMALVVFSLANETYGIPTEYVHEVQPLREVTPVPCTPDFCVGIVNIRGSLYSVIDIRGFLGVEKQPLSEKTKVILVSAAGLQVGILADDVSGATSIQVSQIKPALAVQRVTKEEYVSGVTKEMLTILNLEAILRDERIIIHEEVA